ncbi:MAG: hypothetical protein O6945_01135 [Gammaproteobacteria bacterium]|nr:hypothetical protein [Gammaproteobacteria bacterium]
MKIRHIRSTDTWLLSKGNKILYRGKQSPWQSPKVIATALRRDGLHLLALPI